MIVCLMHFLMFLSDFLIQLIKRPAAVLLGYDCFQGDAYVCFSKCEEQSVEALLRKLVEDENFLWNGHSGRGFRCISNGICAGQCICIGFIFRQRVGCSIHLLLEAWNSGEHSDGLVHLLRGNVADSDAHTDKDSL